LEENDEKLLPTFSNYDLIEIESGPTRTFSEK